jgi:signal transduction histidine kinase
LFKFNKRSSAFAYIQKINHLNEILVYLIDNTRQKDLELNVAHSQKMQAIGQLAGGIAHDFNNLLTAMLGFCDLLLCKHPAGDSSFPELMQIKQNIIRAINLVRNLLAFSRKQILEVCLINVNDVILNISDLLRRLIGENIFLKTSYSQDLGCIKVDQGQLEQVIINLVLNARDAMEEEGGEINIKTYCTTVQNNNHGINNSVVYNSDNEKIEDGEYIVIEVDDDGCGIDEESCDKIFEPFYSTKDIGAGTGLGLSMAYGIVKQSEGYIYFTTSENYGSTFYLYFKKTNGDNYKGQQEEYHEKTLPEPSIDLTGNNIILLVEDEDSVRLFGIHALKNKGYEVFSARSGDEALMIIDGLTKEIDLVITDVIMPGISGYQLAEKIKEISKE